MKISTKKLSEAAEKLFGLIPADGGFVGNTSLQRTSQLGEEYWNVRRELLDGNWIILGKGRGGSVARRPLESASEAEAEIVAKRDEGLVADEDELYVPLKQWLEKNWGREVEEAGDFFSAKITATGKNRLRASGQWSRPDVTVVQVNSYEYLPQASLEVTTFEVKRFSDGQNISSVFEAAAHSRWAQHAYLVIEVPNRDYEFSERFISEIERFRLGLIFMWRENGKWEVEEEEWESKRLDPDPKELEALLQYFFQDDNKGAKEFKKAIG